MKSLCKKERGLLSLEASISLTIFIFLMLFFYSFFIVFEARNIMAHTLLATSKSLSLDSHESEVFDKSGDLSQIFYGIYNNTINASSKGYTSTNNWGVDTDLGNEEQKAELANLVKQRFVAYFSDGNTSKANELLKNRYHVKNGLNGVDFSETKIVDGKLYISMKYTLEYEYQVFGKGDLTLKQSCCSKLWK